jgi:uncharacterized coiled-coil protein SlyX
LTTPRKDKGLKSAHDQAFYNWAAAKENTAVICGHTHQPVFTSKTHIDALKDKLLLAESEFEKKKIQEQIHALREEFTSLQENPCEASNRAISIQVVALLATETLRE